MDLVALMCDDPFYIAPRTTAHLQEHPSGFLGNASERKHLEVL